MKNYRNETIFSFTTNFTNFKYNVSKKRFFFYSQSTICVTFAILISI